MRVFKDAMKTEKIKARLENIEKQLDNAEKNIMKNCNVPW
jgi:hypothetical protein